MNLNLHHYVFIDKNWEGKMEEENTFKFVLKEASIIYKHQNHFKFSNNLIYK